MTILSREAKADFRRFQEFLNPKNPNAVIKAVKRIRKRVDALADNPELGTSLEDKTDRRELYIQFGKNGYVLSYLVDYEAK